MRLHVPARNGASRHGARPGRFAGGQDRTVCACATSRTRAPCSPSRWQCSREGSRARGCAGASRSTVTPTRWAEPTERSSTSHRESAWGAPRNRPVKPPRETAAWNRRMEPPQVPTPRRRAGRNRRGGRQGGRHRHLSRARRGQARGSRVAAVWNGHATAM